MNFSDARECPQTVPTSSDALRLTRSEKTRLAERIGHIMPKIESALTQLRKLAAV